MLYVIIFKSYYITNAGASLQAENMPHCQRYGLKLHILNIYIFSSNYLVLVVSI